MIMLLSPATQALCRHRPTPEHAPFSAGGRISPHTKHACILSFLFYSFYHNLQPRCGIGQILHLCPRPLRVQSWVGPLPVPGPLLRKLRRQLALKHLHDVLAQHREELVPVERAAGCYVEALGSRVWGDDKVSTGCEGVPSCRTSVGAISLLEKKKTYQQIRCFSMVQWAPLFP